MSAKTTALIVFLLCPALARAGETAAFLNIGVGARPLAIGGAYTAIANDALSLAWNPAGLGGMSQRELGFSHAELGQDSRFDYASYAHPTKYGTLGAAAGYMSQGMISGRDATGKPTNGFTAADTLVTLGYGARLGSGYKLGGSVKVISSHIAEVSANTVAFDLGAQRELEPIGPGTPLLGFSMLNLGPGMRFADTTSPLPLALATGLGYRLPAGVTIAADYRYRPNSHYSEVAVGTEYALFSNFALRGGYGTTQNTAGPGISQGTAGLGGVAMGFGLMFKGYRLDYSITPFGELGNVQRFSLGARW